MPHAREKVSFRDNYSLLMSTSIDMSAQLLFPRHCETSSEMIDNAYYRALPLSTHHISRLESGVFIVSGQLDRIKL